MSETPAMDRVRHGYGDTPPQWVVLLAEACDAASQHDAARLIGFSPPVVNQVLKGDYKGNLGNVQSAVEGAFGGAVVGCPVLGEISTTACLGNQRLKLKPTNPQRVRLFQACRAGCPHSRLPGPKS